MHAPSALMQPTVLQLISQPTHNKIARYHLHKKLLSGSTMFCCWPRFTRIVHPHNAFATSIIPSSGHEPATKFLDGQLKLDDAGYIVTALDSTATSIEGVFAAGDVQVGGMVRL